MYLLAALFLFFAPALLNAQSCGNVQTVNIGEVGPGFDTISTDPPEPDLPDFILDSLILKDTSGNERYSYGATETIEMHSYSKNIGDADWAAFEGQSEAEDIDVRFYLSTEYKEDDHDDWIRVGLVQEISKGNLDVGDTKHEYTSLSLATADNGSPLTPGVYNIVACVDRNQDDHNEDGEVPEKHKSNNCSTEAVFTVTEPNYVPTGYVDIVNCTGIQGWAIDQNTEGPVDIHVYAGYVYVNNPWFVTGLSADVYRADVGSHGFSWTLPTSFKTGTAYKLFFYAIDSSGGSNPLIGQTQITCATPVNNLYPTYRCYRQSTLSHFYTIWEGEKNSLVAQGWTLEGVGFWSLSVQEANTYPVYRFYRTGKGHFYTISEAEKNSLIGVYGWTFEGVAFYNYATQVYGTVPIYRMYSSSRMTHLFTSSWDEVLYTSSVLGYTYEGIGWYAFTAPPY